LTGDFVGEDRHQVNPKLGVTWTLFPGTTFRAAAFRVLKRTLPTNQTLEPTQVAGFNQFFDDLNHARSWRFGGAIDQKFTKSLFGGIEFSNRDLTVPFQSLSPAGSTIRDADWTENLARSYLFWTPAPWLGLKLEYQYDRFRRDENFRNGFERMDIHRVPLELNYFHPSGWSAFLTATYFNQTGEFEQVTGTPPRPGSQDFWTVDAGIKYRLPMRYGFLTFGASNLFDRRFKFFDSDINNPSMQPNRMIFGRLTLALP
jgi:outer membrane receptor protein involved in Fe transport